MGMYQGKKYCDLCGKEGKTKAVNMDLNGRVAICKECEKKMRNFIQ